MSEAREALRSGVDGAAGAARRARRAAATRFFNALWYGDGARARPVAAALLRPLGGLYCTAASARAFLYATGILRRVELPVPVVVVGNISVGGTGKTPLLIWLAGTLAALGYRPGIVARGYGGASSEWPRDVSADSDPREVGDEPVLLARRTRCPVAVGPDRVAAARRLLERHGVGVLLADDGLQHYRLARTVEIAVVDGERGLGNGRCLPAGPLRERPARLARADAVVVNGGGADGGERRSREEGESEAPAGRLARLGVPAVQPPAIAARLETARVYSVADGREAALEDFAGRRVRALAGIGHPERFFAMLRRAGLEVVAQPLPDHAPITAADLAPGPDPVLLTEKDAVKCRAFAPENVWCVTVDMRFEPAAAERLLARVLQKLPPPLPRPPAPPRGTPPRGT